MDRLERLAFNSLPAALWPDVTANVYHHRSNQIQCGGQYGFNLFFCCSSNVHQGWPKFMLSAVQLQPQNTSTSGGGGGGSGGSSGGGSAVVISGYAPSFTTLPDGGGTVNVTGTYPFSDTATITLSKPTKLQLRIPCWTDGASVTTVSPALDGTAVVTTATDAVPCTFYSVDAAATTIKVAFDVPITFYRWVANQTDGSYSGKDAQGPPGTNGGGVEVHRGALTFALRPTEVVQETTIGCIGGSPEGRYGWNCTGTPGGVPQFPAIKSRDVQVATEPGSGGNWSYGILPHTATFVTVGTGTPPAGYPFSVDAPPAVAIKIKARNLNWNKSRANLGWSDPGCPPHSPLASDAPLEEITLVPFGSTNIRISVFPELIA